MVTEQQTTEVLRREEKGDFNQKILEFALWLLKSTEEVKLQSMEE